MVQTKLSLATTGLPAGASSRGVSSVAVSVTLQDAAASSATVPELTPLRLSMVRPDGRAPASS